MRPAVLGLLVAALLPPAAPLPGVLTPHLREWLSQSVYAEWLPRFARDDLGEYGSFGGKRSAEDVVGHQPVVFVHGNSDRALHDPAAPPGLTGWSATIEYFLNGGYTEAELYATTWGPASLLETSKQVHSCDYILQLRKFIEAVLAYTGAEKVDLIAHSMGVTLARKVVKGGWLAEAGGSGCDVGPPLTDRVDTFVGIAGGNRGLTACYSGAGLLAPACNDVNGFFPGVCPSLFCLGTTDGLSEYLVDLNNKPRYEGSYIYSIWSRGDNVILYGDLVWGYPTSEIPGQDAEKVYDVLTHIQLKDETLEVQYNAVVSHNI